MSALTDLRAQAAQAACFKCLPVDTAQAIKTYLLAVIAGGSLDPKTILSQARGFFAIPSGMLPAVQATLAATLAGSSVTSLISQSPCAVICQTVDDSLAIQLRSLAVKASGSTDPKTLAKLAACFVCIPTGRQASVQAFLMAVIAGVVPAPPAIPPGTPGPAPTGPPPSVPPIILKTAIKQFALPPKLVQMTIGDALFVYAGGGTGVKPGTPTGFSFVLAGDHSVINVSWDAVPAGATSTELWTSTDNVTFALESSITAPATTTTSPVASAGVTKYGKIRWCNIGGCSAFTASQSAGPVWPLTESWQARVVTNGGAAPGAGTVAALKTFEVSIQSILSQIVLMNVIAPDSLIAAFTPFIKPVGGNDPWTNTGYVLADLSVAGFQQSVASPHLRTGVTQLAFAYGHIGIEIVAFSSEENVYDFGCSTAAVGTEYWLNTNSQFYGGQTEVAEGKNFFPAGGYGNVHVAAFLAFWAAERTATNLMNLYQGDSGTGFNLTGTENGAIAADARTGTVDFQFAGQNVSGASTGVSQIRRYSYISATTGLSAADTQTLFNAVKALRLGFGGGAP